MDEEIPYNELLLDVEDGIVVGLYHYLWLKDGKGRACPEVNIPHTIIICNGRPKVWYFTSGKEQCIKRKNRANITNATVTEALAPTPKPAKPSNAGFGGSGPSGDLGGGLVGTWGVTAAASQSQRQQPQQGGRGAQQQQAASKAGQQRRNQQQQQQPPQQLRTDSLGGGGGGVGGERVADGTSTGTALGPWPHHGVVARFQGSMTMPHNGGSGVAGGGGAATTRGASLGRRRKGFELQDEAVEFFSREQLGEMLPPGTAVVHGVAALHEGVLQKFVQPRGQHHFSIRATWSPNACVVERRTSKAKLNDPRVPLAERLAGWDGPNWLSDHTLITGTVLHGSICRLCDNVAAHLADVSGGAVRVLRMVLFFCVDEANRIWLTHCGTLKTQRLREYVPPGPHLQSMPPANRLLRAGAGSGGAGAGGGAPPLLLPSPSPSVALRLLRSADGGGGGSGGGALSGDPNSLDLPAPSAAFATSKAAAAAAEGGGGGGGRFLCVLTGEMYPSSQRCDVTYKQLLQHWFSLASQLPNEGDRLRAMDTIPLAIRRANPSLTREWYLRVRSQPTFLYRTAPVCLEAAAQITGLALDELQRSVLPPATATAAAAAAAGPGQQAVGSGQHASSSPGNATGLLGGWGGAGALVTHGTPQMSARGAGEGVLSRQTTGNTTAAAVRVPLGPSGSGRQRPATALPPTGPSHLLLLQQPQQSSVRSGLRMQQQQQHQAQQQHHPGATPATTTWRFMPRSKSASPSVAASRPAPAAGVSGGGAAGGRGGGGGAAAASGLPSMLLPREFGQAGVSVSGGGGALGRQPSFLQVYGPTPEQAAEAAAAAAALPYEVLDEVQQMADDVDDGPEGEREGPGGGQAAGCSPRGGRRDDSGDGGGGNSDDTDAAASAAAEPYDSGAGASSGVAAAMQHHPLSPSSSASAHPGGTAGCPGGGGGGGGSRSGSPPRGAGGAGLGPSPAYAGAAAASTSASAASRPHHGSRSRFPPGRVSTSSEIAEVGSMASFSDPNSPNGTHTGLSNPHAHGHGHGLAYGHPPAATGGVPSSSSPSSRLSPPRSAGLLTLHTIHEEGAAAVALPLPPSAGAAGGRPISPGLPGSELLFPPPSRGGAGGSHSVPRMRPHSRGGGGAAAAAGGAGASRRHIGGPGQQYVNHHGGGGAAAGGAGGGGGRCNSFSESGDLPAVSGYGGGGGGYGGGGGMCSLNSTMASSVGSLSRRSTSNQAVLSTEDLRTLRELSEAYTAAERLTQQLLAQAHDILSEDGGSRPGSTGTSPLHGGRAAAASRPPTAAAAAAAAASSPRGAATNTSRPGTGSGPAYSNNNGSGNTAGGGGLVRVGSGGSGRPGTAVQRLSNSSILPPPGAVAGPVGPGPSPLGQRDSFPAAARTAGFSRSSIGAAGGGAASEAGGGPDSGLTPAPAPALPPMLVRGGSAGSGSAHEAAGRGTGMGMGAEGAGGSSGLVAGGGSGVGAAAGPHPVPPPDLALLTSAEADLLAEALQD
ncbi:hypothetical protein PLESTF_001863200 [Pleodorina starrii]|nr:hypothetical protein PLESTF_001863200 [Pleodorina starrii]